VAAFARDASSQTPDLPRNLQVQLNNSTSVRSLANNLLISDVIIPAGAIVEVPVAGFQNAPELPFWSGQSQQKSQFVKGVRVISAPGFSAAEIERINSWNQDEGIFIAKSVLGNALVVPNAARTEKLTVQRPTQVYRDDGHSQDPRPRSQPANQLDRAATENVVTQIQQGNHAAHSAGTVPQFCPGCEKDLLSKIVAQGVPQKALEEALAEQAKNPKGLIHNKRFITIVDFTKDSGQKRMFIIDMQSSTGAVEKLYTSNGRGSETVRPNHASHFSNQSGSHATPAGFHVTGYADASGIHTTAGLHHSPSHNNSLLLIGLEAQNSNSARRDILIHSANYATETFAEKYSRVGRSAGCLAIDPKRLNEVLSKIQGGSLVYNYTGN